MFVHFDPPSLDFTRPEMRIVQSTQSRSVWLTVLVQLFVIYCAITNCSYVVAADSPFELQLPAYDDVIVVPALIGESSHLCVLDSGATYCVFHTSLRNDLGQSLSDGSIVAANGEKVSTELAAAPEIRI